MPNTVLDYVRSKEPRFADVPDDELTSFIAEKHPEFLQVPEFKADVDSLGTKGFESEEVVSSETSRAEKRAALAKEMSAERLRGMGAKALENLVGSVEATAKSITNPIEFIKQTERGVEAAATLITGEPKVLTVKPSEVMQRPLAKIPDLVPSDLLDSNLKASVEGAAEMLGLGKPDLTTVAKMGAGVANAVIGFANFMQTPEGVALLGTGKLPEAARRSVSVAIAAQMAVHAPESFNAAVEAARAGDVQTAAQRATEFIGGTAIAAKAADHGFTGPQVMVNRLRAADAPATAEAVKEATGTKEPPPTPPSTGPKPLPDEFRVTVMPEQKLPSYVQIDQPPPPTPTPGVDIVSGRPEQVAQKGYEVPDLSKLPPGRYTVGELREKGLLNPPEPAKPVETKGMLYDADLAAGEAVKPGEQVRAVPSTPESIAHAETLLTSLPDGTRLETSDGQQLVLRRTKNKKTGRENISLESLDGNPLEGLSRRSEDGTWTIDSGQRAIMERSKIVSKPVETKAPVPETKPVEPVTEPPKVETPKPVEPPKAEEAPPNATPMQKRYFDLKRNLAPGEILAIRMGDFYEVFGQDAATVAKLARIALTKRNNVQMAGVPFHAAQRFAEKIAEGGKKLVFDEGERAKPAEPKVETPKAPEPEPVKAHEERIGRKGKQADPFQMDEGDLADLFEERFGTKEPPQPGQFGRQGKFTFPTYDEFKKWMDARYAERDLEGMKMAFAEADTPTKVRYVKDNRASDPALKAWIAHIATGAELPKDNPAVPRTTPRPMPGGGTQPVQGPPSPPRQGQPPPPPRQPTSHRKFDIMALTQLFRQFGNSPVVNKRLQSAYGRFVPDKEAVELKQRLLWDTALAERVLGHEIGHYIDLIVPLIGKGRQLANRLRPLWDFRGEMWRKQELRQEARALSREWRGPFTNGDRYRDSAAELFADFMSAMFNKPEWVNQNYPKLFDSFQHLRDGKPQFASAYREIETWLQGNTMALEWIDQQKGAAKRTIDDLMEETKKPKRSFMDTLKGNFVSIWHRAFEKEGKPRELGSSLTDELEYSNSWAAKENAIFKDDFQKTVEPELKKVHADPLEARSLLHAYSQARRTIGERRAAGVWIEQNPVEARTMLERLLEVNDELRSKFGNQLASAPDSALYDLSAAIFREIHDRGERFVDRMAKEINELDLGVSGDAALQAFNVRGKLLNPGGLTPENAVKVLDTLKDRLTADQWRALEKAGSALRDLIYDTQEKAYNEGLISRKTWEELIEPNRDNYVPYAVLDHWEGKVRGGVMPQKGTAKDIADVTLAAQLKIGALNAWRQKQRQVQLLRDTYAKGGQPIPVGEALKKSAQIDDIRKKNAKDDVSRAVLWQDGKPHLVEFPGDPGKTLEMAMDSSAFYEHMDWIHSLSGLTHQLMQLYTTLSVPFLVYRNPIRGARTGALRTGFRAIGKQYLSPEEMKKASAMAKNYAEAAFGGEMSPEIRQLVDQQVLLPPRLSATMVRDAANLKELLETGGVLATEVKQLHGEKWPWWKGGKPGKAAFEAAEKVFTGYEAFEKIQNYLAAKARGATEEQATAIGRRAGIPKPGVGGHLSLATEVMFPWARVHIQGIRSTLDFLRDPTYRKGFVTRFAMTEALPRILKVGIASGVIAGGVKWLLSDDEDKNDTVMAEVFRRVSPYKMALDDVVPLMLYDPRTGSYHYFNDFKSGSEIPKHYEVVSFRIPSSEEGRLWGTLLYNTLSSIPGAKEKVARPGTDFMSNVGDWAKNNLSVGISPAIETSGNLYQMIALGRNPEDSFRGQPAANQRLFDAGGVERAQAIAGYTLNQLGGPGEIAAVMAMNAGILDKRATDALKKRIASDKTPLPERLPLAKNMFSYDNYASFREQKQADIADQQLRAKARLVMSENVQALYDFYYKNVKHHDKLQGGDQIRYRIASAFVSQIWGDLKNPNSFYARAAHAVGPDGSKMARETVRRDLDQALSGAMIEFQRAGQ